MKTKEQRKAELLDWFVRVIMNKIDEGTLINTDEMTIISLHKQIESEKTLQQDPYADEVFKGQCGSRLINLTVAHLAVNKTPIRRKDLRLSDMPHVSVFENAHGVGRMSIEYYKDVMIEYGFTDKLT